jgi:hypothetical protein
MSGNYGTAYGREIKPQKLGREALGLAACDLIDMPRADCNGPQTVTLEAYGSSGALVVYSCPNCGESCEPMND